MNERETRRNIARLDHLVARLDMQGALEINSGNAARAKFGDKLMDEAFAVRWAIREIEKAGAGMEAAE